MEKKIMRFSWISAIIIFGLSFMLFLTLAFRKPQTQIHDFRNDHFNVNKLILCIGDGMGENHIKISETYLEKAMVFNSFYYQGYVDTSSKNIFGPTDSAAAATAMATGNKVKNGSIGKDGDESLKSITEYAHDNHLGVAIITTDDLFGATPACFSSHANNRKDTFDIIESQLHSNVDLFLGAGYDTYANYKTSFEDENYYFCHKYQDLSLNHDKIIGSFQMVKPTECTDEMPSLVQLVAFAYTFMEKKFPNGYFMMIEEAHIDKMSHKNRIHEMIKYLAEFNEVIKNLNEKYHLMKDVAILVTSDHETGNLTSFSGTKNDIKDNLYHSTSHSRQDVKYFLEIFGDDTKYDIPQKIDNTDIFRLCYQLLIE